MKEEKMGEKIRKTDRRTQYTQQSIKNTFLKLLEEKSYPKITVTEICRLAEINRGTFYLHYYDTADVLDDILTEMIRNTSGVIAHVLCPHRSACTYPFCERIQQTDSYRALFLDETLSEKIIEKLAEQGKESYITWLMSHSILTFEEAEALFYFQMNGCLSINKLMLKNHTNDWQKIQRTIDAFLKAGLESFLIHDQRDDFLP